MKFRYESMALIPVIICMLASIVHAQCVYKNSFMEMVEVTVVYEFEKSELRTDLMYKSIIPALIFDEKKREPITRLRINSGRAEFVFCIWAGNIPPLNSKLTIDFGPRIASANVRPITWKNTEFKDRTGKILREGKMAPIYLLRQPDPDWPILQSARLLPGTEKNKAVLEVIIDNKGNQVIAFENLILLAEHPRDGMGHCGAGDHTETLTLNWNRITHGLDQAAWKKFKDEEVYVKVLYNGLGECSPYSFKATVPVQNTVAAKQIMRITLILNELPVIDRRTKNSLKLSKSIGKEEHTLRETPLSIVSWKKLSISLEPLVFPQRVEVIR